MCSIFTSFPSSAFLCLCIATYVLRCRIWRRPGSSSSHSCSLAPGPPLFPLIGNIYKIPPSGAWKTFTKYKAIYGDVVYFQGLGNNVLVLNTIEAVNELLDRRGSNYSHRPIFTVVGELMGLGQSMPLLPYGEEWRNHRRLARVALSPTAVRTYHSVQEDLAIRLCNDLIDNPAAFFSLVRLTAGRIIMSITYGIPVGSVNDKYITHAEKTMDIIGEATVPGAFLCDLLPCLKHFPSWVPFQQKALIGKAMIERLVSTPFERVKVEVLAGVAAPSLAQNLLTSLEYQGMPEFEHRVKWTTGAMYGGECEVLRSSSVTHTDSLTAGGETTYATVLTFMMAMALHPLIQRRAQEEIDSVIGTERLPTITDSPNLPYVRSVIKETMRWHPVLPLSIARRSENDDVYNGSFIPKGTIVIPNVYAIALETKDKYDPRDFIPERFINPEKATIDPSSWAFGFGRRICPGKDLAENSVFIIIASILSVFTISPPKGETLTPKFGQNLVSYPEPFKCGINPRSEKVERLVRQSSSQYSL